MRLSLGASRGRLVRQLLVESLVLSFIGGIVGPGPCGRADARAARADSAEGQPLLITATPDLRILAFTLGLTFVTGIVFGLLPALRASRPDPWTTLKDTMGSIAGDRGSLFLRKGLVTAQVALSFLLLFGAGLFVRSLQNLKTTDTGVALDNLVTFQLSPVSAATTISAPCCSIGSCSIGCVGPGRQVGRDGRRADPERRRVGQLDGGRGSSRRGRRRHAGVHERAVAGLLRDDAHSHSRRARFRGEDASRTATSRS